MARTIVCTLVAALLLVGCATTRGGVTAQNRAEPVTPGSPNRPIDNQPNPALPRDAIPNLPPVPPIAKPDRIVEPIKDKDGKIDWGVGMIRVTGKAALDPSNPNKGQEILKAERAATVDAQRKLLEITKGVRINGETMVEDLMLKNDFVITQVEGIVKGARPIGDPKYDSTRGIVTVEMMMNLYGADGIAEALRPSSAVEQPARPLDPKTLQLLSKYSGIVIQGAGTNGKPAMFPRLYDEQGNLVLDTRDLVGQDARSGQPVVQFVENMNDVLSNPELARNPLIIKVKELQGKYLSDYVLPKDQLDVLKAIRDALPYLAKVGRFLISLL
jgi:hypothetical protein